MKSWLFSGVCLAITSPAGPVCASAWPQTPGQTQIITSLEPGHAKWAYDSAGTKSLALHTWDQADASVYIDHGLTKRFTVTTKLNLKAYHTDSVRFSGLSSVELGGRWAIHKGDDYVMALGGSVDGLGHARRNDFDTGEHEGTDYDLRAYMGKSFTWRGHNSFVNVEGARHLRQFEADQWRLEGTIGIKSNKDHGMLMLQAFAGQADKRAGFQSQWLNLQASVVHPIGRNSLQLGVRSTIAGKNVPAVTALIVSLWRNF